MMPVIVWLLIATASSGSPSRLATLKDEKVCRTAAATLENQSRNKGSASTIYAYCIPVPGPEVFK